MADIHILANNQIIVHVDVPDAINSVGVNWRDAIVIDNGGAPTSQLADAVVDGSPEGWEITVAEKALIASGALIEVSTRIDLDKFAGTLADKRDAMLVVISQRIPNVLKQLQARYKYFGYSGSA